MLKTYKYRLYPNKKQKIQLAKTFGCCRFIYNQILAKKIDLYKTEKKSISKYDCNSYCNNELKKQYIWLKEVDKFALTNSIYNLDNAYKKFFKEHTGFPRFKSKHNHNYSYITNFTNNNIEADFKDNKIKLPKLKWIKCKLHREFIGKIKSATISQVPSGKYFVSILVNTENIQLLKNNNIYAFDLGLKEFLIDSNNKHIQNPKTLYQYEKNLKNYKGNLLIKGKEVKTGVSKELRWQKFMRK